MKEYKLGLTKEEKNWILFSLACSYTLIPKGCAWEYFIEQEHMITALLKKMRSILDDPEHH